jgi:cyclomaltodextrinase / maltogenic alpha-amylase / neopullulanase
MLKNFFSISLIILSSVMISKTISAQQLKSYVNHPAWSYNQSIYEVNLRQYTEEGSFKAFARHLPELKKMGVGILWFMPLNPIGIKNRKGKLGSYYSVKDYYAIDSSYGTSAGFKRLVKEIHKLGMHVIVDWVADHTSWDNNLTVEHTDWYKKDSAGNFMPPVKDWSDVIALNYDNKNLRKYMIGALEYWVKTYNIDGFRCDVADMVPTDFWNKARAELEKIKPVFMLAEAETPELQVKAFDMTYSWKIYRIMNGIAAGKNNAADISKYFKWEEKNYPENDFRMRFTTNHDINSWDGTVFERLGKAAETFAVFSAAIPGMPLVYSGQEAGLNKRLDFFDKDTINWKKSKFREIYTKLLNLKIHNHALWNGTEGGEIELISNPKDKYIYSFVRKKDNDKIFVVFNFSNKPRAANLSDKDIEGNYKDLFSGKNITLSEKEKFKLPAWGYKFLVSE